MRTYIKIYGPPVWESIRALEKIAADSSQICVGDRCDIIKKASETVGDYNFYFEWKKNPTMEQINALIEKIDNAFATLGSTYTITTK